MSQLLRVNPTVGRWLWFVGLWAGGVLATGLVSLVIRFWLR